MIMSDYYSVESDIDYWEYVNPDYSGLSNILKTACMTSEFQYITNDIIKLNSTENSGKIFPDFIYNPSVAVPIVSEKLKMLFDSFGIDNLLYRKILLNSKPTGLEKLYFLALPPRINCLDIENTSVDQYIGDVDNLKIDDYKIGYYDIFKISGITNNEIIISAKLFSYLSEKSDLVSIYFKKI